MDIQCGDKNLPLSPHWTTLEHATLPFCSFKIKTIHLSCRYKQLYHVVIVIVVKISARLTDRGNPWLEDATKVRHGHS